MTARQLVLIELNEINFDVVEKYVGANPGMYPAFESLLGGCRVWTSSERKYEMLEPWIQWPSVHTGLTQAEHGVFRLGDIVASDAPQIFEQLEAMGVSSGAISAMNAANRLLRPAYFVPDPWTVTPTDGSWWSRNLSLAVSQAVNDNSQARIAPRSALILLLGLLRYARFRNYGRYAALAFGARRSSWMKALFLDLFLNDFHLTKFRSCQPGFSVLFLNAGAHIQHHYFYNSAPLKGELGMRNPEWYVPATADPIGDMLQVYDRIVGDYLLQPESELIVATGLSQKPYDRVKFYYRLRDHAAFLRALGISFTRVLPRMTRDFLVEFESNEAALAAQQALSSVTIGGELVPLFGEIDNRGDSLFVTLTYPEEIIDTTEAMCAGSRMRLHPHVVFVAIKNGMHQDRGYAFLSGGLRRWAPADGAHVKELHSTIRGFFGIPATSARCAIAD